MRLRFHAIYRKLLDGGHVGWVEEIPGTISRGRTLEECRENLRESLNVVIESHRQEASMFADASCRRECVEVDTADPVGTHLA